MKHKAILATILLLLLSQSVYAAVGKVGEFLSSQADTINQFFSELSGRMVYSGLIWTKINAIKYEVYGNLADYLLKEPPINNPEMSGLIGYFQRVMQPIYVMAIISVGIYLMFFSGSPESRSRAKSILFGLIIGIIILSISIPLMQLLFNISKNITSNILGILGRDPQNMGIVFTRAIDYLNSRTAQFMWTNTAIGLPFLILSLIIASGLVIGLGIRYFVLIFLTVSLPLVVFLTMFRLTRNIGWIFVKHLIFWLFLPAGYALVIVAVTVGSENLSGMVVELSEIVNVTGALLLIFSPLMMYRLVSWFTDYVGTTINIIPVIETEQTEEKKTTQATAVGAGGYSKAPEKKKEEKTETSVGLRGIGTQEPKTKDKGILKKAREGVSRYVTTTRRMLNVENETRDETTISDGERRTSLRDLEGEVTKDKSKGMFTDLKKPMYSDQKGVGMSMHLAKTNTPAAKENQTTMSITKKPLSAISIELGPGESTMVETKLLNDTRNYLFKVTCYDDGISDAGFDVSYVSPSFSMKIEEEKSLKIKISAPESMKKGSYEGGRINFKSEKGIIAMLEINILVGEHKKAQFGETDDDDVSFSKVSEGPPEKEKKPSELNKETNLFGEKVSKKGDGKEVKKETGGRMVSTIKTPAKQAEKDYGKEDLIQRSLRLLGPLASFDRKKKGAKLLQKKKG